jgi:hypothetical protein
VIPEPPIITTDKWGAKPPRGRIVATGRPERILFHHTAGHHPELENPRNESRAEAIRYALAIQAFHFSEGWIDSGHNLLVCRNGLILVGRHHSLTELRRGRMVVSAHCPGQNDQPGIEHEHNGTEAMTREQYAASVWLHAWIIQTCGMRPLTAIHPHRQYFATSCPGVLEHELPRLRQDVMRTLNNDGPL